MFLFRQLLLAVTLLPNKIQRSLCHKFMPACWQSLPLQIRSYTNLLANHQGKEYCCLERSPPTPRTVAQSNTMVQVLSSQINRHPLERCSLPRLLIALQLLVQMLPDTRTNMQYVSSLLDTFPSDLNLRPPTVLNPYCFSIITQPTLHNSSTRPIETPPIENVSTNGKALARAHSLDSGKRKSAVKASRKKPSATKKPRSKTGSTKTIATIVQPIPVTTIEKRTDTDGSTDPATVATVTCYTPQKYAVSMRCDDICFIYFFGNSYDIFFAVFCSDYAF